MTIAAGAASATIAVTPQNDTAVEVDETVVATLSASAAYTVGTPSSGTVTIVSDDVALPTVTLAATTGTATEAGAVPGVFTVTRTGSTAAALTVSYTVGGTATAGSDYTALPGSVTIAAGAASATIAVTPINDTLLEVDETVVVTLSTSASYAMGAPSSGTVTIVSDEVLPTVTLAATTATATEAGTSAGVFTVTRTGSTAAALSVLFSVGGTATPGADYLTLPGSVTIAPGAASATITVTPINDTLLEVDETVVVTLSPSAGYAVGGSGSGTVTIVSDEVLPTVTLAATTPTATEVGSVAGVFTVSRTGGTAAPLTVSYTVGGSATAGSDYTGIGASVTIPAGATTATITVMPVNDTMVEGDETVVVTLSTSAAYTVAAAGSATVTIVSDDVLPTVSIAATTGTATEAGPSAGMFTVTRTGSTAATLSVLFTVGGTATPGADYLNLPGSVAIPAGSATTTITVTPVNDTAVEGNETVVVTLSASAAYTVGAPGSATVTIASDDGAAATVSIAATTPTATEAGPGAGVFTVTRSGEHGRRADGELHGGRDGDRGE